MFEDPVHNTVHPMDAVPKWFRLMILKSLERGKNARRRMNPQPEWFLWSRDERRLAGKSEREIRVWNRLNRGQVLSTRWFAKDPCVWCYTFPEPHERTVEHVVPVSSTEPIKPIALACTRCNAKRANRPFLQFLIQTRELRR